MANAWYDLGRQNAFDGNIPYSSGEMDTILVDAADYTRDLAAHDALADVAGAARVSISDALTSKTNDDATLDAADITHSSVSGDPTEEIILYYDSGGAETADYLMINWDTSVSTIPNGGDITIQWNASGISSCS